MVLLVLLHLAYASSDFWGDDSGRVAHLTGTEMFRSFRGSHPRLLAFFYAPWCGHCKNAKPEFAAASRKADGILPFAAIDCTAEDNSEICTTYDVKSYPTITYFEAASVDGERFDEGSREPYTGGRTAGDFVEFANSKFVADENTNFKKLRVKALKQILADRGIACRGCTEKAEFVAKVKESISLPKVDKKKMSSKKAEEFDQKYGGRSWAQERRARQAAAAAAKGWEDQDNGKVVHSHDDAWGDLLDTNGGKLVFFYAPWCGHCKNLKPTWAEASTAVAADTDAQLVAIDCTVNKETCTTYNVNSYPTIFFFEGDGDKKGEKYEGGRDLKSLTKYVYKKSGIEISVQPWTDEKLWGDDNGEVKHLTDDHFDAFLKDNPKTLVMFHAPWCGHCKALKPKYAEASSASSMISSDFKFGAVDCTVHSSVCGRYAVNGYPTIKYFGGGDEEDSEPVDYSGGRETDDLVEFAKAKGGVVTEGKDEL